MKQWVNMGKRWVPLESNPEVLNAFAEVIGAPTDSYSFCDVYGMDDVRFPAGSVIPRRGLGTYPSNRHCLNCGKVLGFSKVSVRESAYRSSWPWYHSR